MKREGEGPMLFSLWATEEREKDLNLSARSYDKTLRSGTQPGSTDTGRDTLIKCSVHRPAVSALIRPEGLVGVRIRGHRAAVVHYIHEGRVRDRGRETERRKEHVICYSPAVVYCRRQSQAGVISLELGHAHT